MVLAWQLDPTKGKCYQNLTQSVSANQTWVRPEHWQGKCSFVPTKWTDSEFQLLLESGRMKEREVASTPGVFEYWDSQELISEKKVSKKRELSGHQSEDILPETDQAVEFQAKMDSIKGFNKSRHSIFECRIQLSESSGLLSSADRDGGGRDLGGEDQDIGT